MLQIKKSCVYLWYQSIADLICLCAYITDSICGKFFSSVQFFKDCDTLASFWKKLTAFFMHIIGLSDAMPKYPESAMTAKHSTRCAFVQETRSAAENITADFAAASSGAVSKSAFLFGIHGLNNQPAIL